MEQGRDPALQPAAVATPGERSVGPKLVWRNTLTITGAVTAILMALFDLSFLFFDLVAPQHNPYIGLFTYLIFPGFLVLGITMILVGLLAARFRFRRRFGTSSKLQLYPRIDLNLPAHRRALLVTAGAVLACLPLVGVVSYNGYHYTDSNQFCGRVCHEVMEPQYTAFLDSPHARVGCAQCHIGSGASWYVKSKLSGLRQVWAVATDSYSRPIPPAIRELRPATETCEQCHWPSKFFGSQLVTLDPYASDEGSTHRPFRMLLKTGGADPSTGPPSGIHWHMALGFTIDYVALDDALQEIPWVRMTDHNTGKQTIYRSDDRPATEPSPEGVRRSIDCMDCHNRPTHVFRSPARAVDAALDVNASLRSLPFAKREVVAALVEPYPNKESGLTGIGAALQRFYRKQHPQVWADQRDQVERLIDAATEIYRTNFFPEMQVNWRTYPNNIGHMFWPGCFRCHDGRHVDDQGEAISSDCSICHDFMEPAGDEPNPPLVQSSQFIHPALPLAGSHAAVRCDRCHTGGVTPSPTCEGCHTEVKDFRAGSTAMFAPFGIGAEPMLRQVTCEGCHDPSAKMTVETIDTLCMDCHEDEEEKFEGMLASWKAEVDQLLGEVRVRAKDDPRAESILNHLRQAGPMHNMEATRAITSSLTGASIR